MIDENPWLPNAEGHHLNMLNFKMTPNEFEPHTPTHYKKYGACADTAASRLSPHEAKNEYEYITHILQFCVNRFTIRLTYYNSFRNISIFLGLWMRVQVLHS